MGHAGASGRKCLLLGRQRRGRPFVRDTLDGLFWWSYDNESYDDERPDFTTDPDLLLTRNDDLWHFGASLVWGFARGWSLRPTIEYNWEDSNIDALAYSSTEYWLTVRKSF